MKSFFVLALFMVPFVAQARVFTDDSGRTVDAELVGVRGDHVVLAKNGKAGRWPISKLSAADQAYVNSWMKDPPKTPQLRVRLFERDGIGASGVFQGETSKGPKSIPILQETEAKAKYKYYEADITNDSQVDAMQLTVSYMLFIVNASNKIVPEAATQGIDKLPAGERKTVPTEAITFHRTKTTSLTLGTNIFGNLNIGSDTSRSKERFGGAWVRVYSQDGQMVGEAKKLIPEL
ncbi:MAG: SHD1 domain-containing protein, partial [Verrucomicrobiota bacterium]